MGHVSKVLVRAEFCIDSFSMKNNLTNLSYERKEPFDFRVGAGQVMPGLEAGVLGMCPGDKRRVHIPSKLSGSDEFKLKDDQR